MEKMKATAIAHPNIALIKYWGNQDHHLRLPSNGSISFNLGDLFTKTHIEFSEELKSDTLAINGKIQSGSSLERLTSFINIIREMAGKPYFANVESESNFPIGTGIASSAAAFAALSLAASAALGLNLSEMELSFLARRGSGSASRSVPGGFVEWLHAKHDKDSFAISIAPENHWDLVDLVAVVETEHKKVGSSEGHRLAGTSIFQKPRVENATERLAIVRKAILEKDFTSLADTIELDSNMMHAVMMTSNPPIFYWNGASLKIMKLVRQLRDSGTPVCYTLDAGPNVHVITLKENSAAVSEALSQIGEIKRLIQSGVGGKAVLIHN